MSTFNHTAISTGAAANAATFNSPLGAIDAAIGNLTTLSTLNKTSVVIAINECVLGTANTYFTIFNSASAAIGGTACLAMRTGDGYGYLSWSGSHFNLSSSIRMTGITACSTCPVLTAMTGACPKLSFFTATASTQATHIAYDSGAAAASTVNSILTLIERYGLMAAS